MRNNRSLETDSPGELIERLKPNPDVLGILAYGSGVSPEGADTDICVVVADRPEGLESVHFWIGCGPVDMNIRTLDELREGGVAELPGFDDVLREGEVLYEREPGLLANLSCGEVSECAATSDGAGATGPVRGRNVPSPGREPGEPGPDTAPRQAPEGRQKDPSMPCRISKGTDPKEQSPKDHSFMRHGLAHPLHKLDHYKDRDPLLCNVLLAGATHWLLGAYTAARGLPYRGEKATLKAIRQNDPDLLGELDRLSGGNLPLPERIELLRRLTDKVLAPVGGPWREGEVLFFADARSAQESLKEEWEDFFLSLMRSGDDP